VRFIESDTVWLRQLSLIRRTTVAAVAADAGAGRGRDQAGLHVDIPHDVAVALSDIDVSLAVESNLVRRAELRRLCGAAVAGMALRTVPCDDRNGLRAQVETQNTITAEVRPVKGAIWADHQPEGIIDRRPIGRFAVGGHACCTRSGDG